MILLAASLLTAPLTTTSVAAEATEPTIAFWVFACEAAGDAVADCQQHPLTGLDVTFTGDQPFTGTTNEQGGTEIAVPAGTYELTAVGDYPLDAVSLSCHYGQEAAAQPMPVALSADAPYLACNAFVVMGSAATSPAATAAPTSPSAEIATAYDVTIVKAACQGMVTSAEPPVVAELEPATVVDGEQVGAADARTMATGVSTIAPGIHELAAGDNAVVIRDGSGAARACAPIGGVVDEFGGLAFAITDLSGESAVVGSVYLAQTDGGTRVTVFVLLPVGE